MEALSDYEMLKRQVEERGKNIEDQEVQNAKLKIEAFKILKKDVEYDLAQILQQTSSLQNKIQMHIKSSRNQDGLFTRNTQDYINCFNINKYQLQELMAQDEAFWSENLDKAVRNSQNLRDKMQ